MLAQILLFSKFSKSERQTFYLKVYKYDRNTKEVIWIIILPNILSDPCIYIYMPVIYRYPIFKNIIKHFSCLVLPDFFVFGSRIYF